MSKLDAAIELLRMPPGLYLQFLDELNAAREVLEAAEKISSDDRQRLLNLIESGIIEYEPLPGMKCPGAELKKRARAFIESLPDPEKEPGK